jgi:hypothetical protein
LQRECLGLENNLQVDRDTRPGHDLRLLYFICRPHRSNGIL